MNRRRLLTNAVTLSVGAAIGASFATLARKAYADEAFVKIELDDPLGSVFGYVHDATKTDVVKYPKRAGAGGATQFCKNCVVYSKQGSDEQWGGCSIFPAKLVNADGWCNAWAPA
ncbi:MAG: hypothetical protein ACI8TX_000092 [Hyphomicrobiaceae bacterium]|jgi:hypothetical protein